MPKTRGAAHAPDEDESPRKSSKKSSDSSNNEVIVELLNDASMATDPTERLDCLRKIQERIIFKVREL